VHCSPPQPSNSLIKKGSLTRSNSLFCGLGAKSHRTAPQRLVSCQKLGEGLRGPIESQYNSPPFQSDSVHSRRARGAHPDTFLHIRGGGADAPDSNRRASFYTGSSCLFNALAVSRPAAKAVFVALLCLRVADLDLYLAVCITGVLFFHPEVLRQCITADRLIRQVGGTS
jgi:hypothetical protein